MKNTTRICFAIAIVIILVPTQYARAEQYDQITQEVDFAAITAANEVQNNLDEGTRTNYDTWDPVPQGVWFGGWPIESRLRMDDVPDTDFVLALATVCQFESDIIMSGAARTLVRLPVHTSADPWSAARLNIYEISSDSNWTFTRENATASTFGVAIGQMRINFTAGTHRLIFWSEAYDPTDLSPTDGNDHFTRSNRTYVFVDAPLKASTYYLFVTYIEYPSDKYVDVYIQPDTLDSTGEWNRSTIATYNEAAPDTYVLEVDHFNVSTGYSFDFRNGYGNSAYGLNVWMDTGDGFDFFMYVDLTTIDRNDYLSFHLPYRSTVTNLSWDITLWEYDPDGGTYTAFAQWNNYLTKDFILFSMAHDWDTCSTATGLLETGWIRVSMSVDNDTRLWIPIWDVGEAPADARVNRSFAGSFMGPIWDSDTTPTYNMVQLIQHDKGGADYYNYHWKPQASIQFNNFQWTKSFPASTGSEDVDPTENMTFQNKIYYGIGSFLIAAGNVLVDVNPYAGGALRYLGTAAQIVAQADVLPDFFGWVRDKVSGISDFFHDIGSWIWRVAQEAAGIIRWFVETITYFASIILGIIIFAFAIVILFLSLWFSAKFAQIIVEALRGRYERSIAIMGEIAQTTGKMVKR
jgi:hypothetical protein